jgi:hypothetical protein
MTHTKPCKFCGLPLTVESDPDCPAEWAESLLGLLACNRCADYRSRMATIGAEIRKICLNLIQMVNSKAMPPEVESKIRKLLEALTWKVAEATCRFHRIAVIYDQDFVSQILENPDKSSAILKTYAGLVRDEARKQRQQHEKRTDPEGILFRSGVEDGHQAWHGVLPHDQRADAHAKVEANQPAGGAGENQGRGLPEETFLI